MERKNNQESRLPAKSKPTERVFWSTTDRLQLLAYLNCCVQSCVNFEATAPGYLKKVTGKHFTKERIRQKLYKEWQTYGSCRKFNDVFELGTSVLLPFVGEEQETFHQMVTNINLAKEANCTQRRSLGPTRLTSNKDLSEDELASDVDTDRVQSEDEFELSTIASPELSDIELELAPTMPDPKEDTMTFISQARLNSSLEVRLSQLEADLLKQKSYSVTLENRISELKRRNDDLEHCISLASSAQSNSGQEAQFREVISSLRDKLGQERLLRKNYEELEADRLGFLNTSLRVEYENLHSNIRDTSSMICHLSRDDNLPEQRTSFPHLANNWARRIGGRDLGSLLSHCEAMQIPKKVILVSLLAAGIFDLVLEKVFPAFLAADSPLLDQYRKHIEIQSGRDALRRLDVLSIKSLVSDKNFKKGIISERSNRLASLILQSLSCFLPLESRNITQRSRHNERETETTSDMRSTLHHALEVKIELMLSVKRLKYLFFRPGTLFDAGKMDVVKSQAGDSTLLSQEVKICLIPALFTMSEAGNESGFEEELSFRANYSKALAEVMDEDIESLVLVEKAIVFL